MLEIWRLDSELWFPSPRLALQEPRGLLAVGGDLSPQRLLLAYRQGIFPWYSQGEPLLWWAPAPRMVLYPDAIKISRSLGKRLRRQDFALSWNRCFAQVIHACAASWAKQDGTWITPEMQEAYINLHQLGYAHSVEVWQDEQLVGGLYGIALGGVFFGESMFSRVSDASKVALVTLAQHLEQVGFGLIDCQVYSPHLASMGAQEIEREVFLASLQMQVQRQLNLTASLPR